jgi:hypothetical protein
MGGEMTATIVGSPANDILVVPVGEPANTTEITGKSSYSYG